MLTYSQTTGTLLQDGKYLATGWAGNHAGKNNPAMQDKPCIGPLPQGKYTLQAWELTHDHLGPMVCFLLPDPSNTMFGRGDFFCHGPSQGDNYGQESKGCIVIPHQMRQTVKDSGQTQLTVIA